MYPREIKIITVQSSVSVARIISCTYSCLCKPYTLPCMQKCRPIRSENEIK